MVWAAGLVCDVVTLQKLLELFGIVARVIVLLIMWGRPNSVTIIDSSVQTAAEVEFGNFLTMMYFEKTSTTIGKSTFFSNRTYLSPMCAMGKEAVPE